MVVVESNENTENTRHHSIRRKHMINWIKGRIGERTSCDGEVCIGLGLMILFMAPLAKIDAVLAIAWGLWTIWKSE